jgi:ribonuclease R
VEAVRQGASESLIEEFMLAANETVARHLRKHKMPTIYRVHDEPDSEKMGEFCQTARMFGYKVAPFPSRTEVNRVLMEAQGTPESYLINLAFLRSLKTAEYSVKNRGHYGLASKNYLHFTSPIRRYPDLMVHRCLDALRDGGVQVAPARAISGREGLAEIAANCSETERRGDAAEREVVEAATLRYLRRLYLHKPGRFFQGLVTDISRYEITVFLPDYLVEGSIRLRSLVGDFYRYDRTLGRLTGVRTRRTFRRGQVVKVRVREIDVIRRELELELVGGRGV